MAASGRRTGVSHEIQKRYQRYVDDMDDLMYSNPNYGFYVGFDSQQLMFRLMARDAVKLDRVVRKFREVDQSSFFTGRRDPVYLYAVSPFGFFPPGLLFDVLGFIQRDFEFNPTNLPVGKMVLIGPKAKSYVYDYLVPLAGKVAALGISAEEFTPSNISMDRAEDPEDPSVRVMRPYQEDAIRQIVFKGNGRCLIQSPTGCHGAGTPVLMADGSVLPVEEVLPGDRLMGDDGTPREVLELRGGVGPMYRIVPDDGSAPFTVNRDHILSLVYSNESVLIPSDLDGHVATRDGYVVDMSLGDYLRSDDHFRKSHSLYRTGTAVEFEGSVLQPTPTELFEAGQLGRLVGSGSQAATSVGDCTKRGPAAVRREFVRGLVESAGGYGEVGICRFRALNDRIRDDVVFIVRSLGDAAYVQDSSSGPIVDIMEPDLDSPCRTRFSVESLGVGEYHGFLLDGNHRYTLGDSWIVTHNSGKSFIVANLIYTLKQQFFQNEPFRTLIYVPSIQLVEQFYKDLLEYGYRPDEVCRFSGSTKAKDRANLATADIVIANSTYCLQHIAEVGHVDMVVGDEAHKTFNHGTAGFSVLENFLLETRLRVGLSGTLPRGFKYNQMVGLTGPKVFDASVVELQDQGFIAHCSITRLDVEVQEVLQNRELLFHPNSIYRVNSVDETGMSIIGSGDAFHAEVQYMVDHCERLFGPVLDYLLDETTLQDNAIVLFDRTEMGQRLFDHLSLLKERGVVDRTPLFLDGSIPLAERERVRAYVEANPGCILIGQSAILSTGINIKSLSKLVLFVGGKALARTIQSIGRILRLKDGKQAEVIDVRFSFKYSRRHAAERKRLYREFYDKDSFDKTVTRKI